MARPVIIMRTLAATVWGREGQPTLRLLKRKESSRHSVVGDPLVGRRTSVHETCAWSDINACLYHISNREPMSNPHPPCGYVSEEFDFKHGDHSDRAWWFSSIFGPCTQINCPKSTAVTTKDGYLEAAKLEADEKTNTTAG